MRWVAGSRGWIFVGQDSTSERYTLEESKRKFVKSGPDDLSITTKKPSPSLPDLSGGVDKNGGNELGCQSILNLTKIPPPPQWGVWDGDRRDHTCFFIR